MSILDKTTNLELTQYGGSPVKAQLYANYNSDMQKIDLSVSQLSASLIGVGARVTTLEGDMQTISNKADNAVSTANEAKATADGMDTRVTAVEGDVSDLKTWKNDTVDPTLEAYDGRLDAIEEVIDTVSTANIDDLIARMDALEQKVDANTQSIDTLNDNLISAVNRITDLEAGLGTTNANINALAGRVTLLEDCCSSVRETLTDHNTRINKNASDISALDARLTRDETNIAGNASDITILATQNNTQSQQIDDLYSKYNALDPSSPTNLYSRVQTLENTVGDTPLQTTAQTVTGAINELLGEVTGVDADEVAYDNAHTGMVASNVQEAIDVLSDSEDAIAGVVGDNDGGLVKDVADLQTTVGDNSAGLVKDVGDLQTTVGDNSAGLVKDVADLGTTVGDNSAGLVKDVADLQTTVGDNSAGLVKDVGDLQTTVGDNSAGLVKDVSDLQTTVGDNTAGLVKDVADLQTTVGDATAGLVKDVADIQSAITYQNMPITVNTRYSDLPTLDILKKPFIIAYIESVTDPSLNQYIKLELNFQRVGDLRFGSTYTTYFQALSITTNNCTFTQTALNGAVTNWFDTTVISTDIKLYY